MKEKRREFPREGSDRRVIARFSDPKAHSALSQTQMWVRLLSALSLGCAVAEIIYGVIQGAPGDILSGVFMATFLVIMTILLVQYSVAIGFYLNNESINNLNITFERQLTFWKAVGIFSVLFLLTYVIFKI